MHQSIYEEIIAAEKSIKTRYFLVTITLIILSSWRFWTRLPPLFFSFSIQIKSCYILYYYYYYEYMKKGRIFIYMVDDSRGTGPFLLLLSSFLPSLFFSLHPHKTYCCHCFHHVNNASICHFLEPPSLHQSRQQLGEGVERANKRNSLLSFIYFCFFFLLLFVCDLITGENKNNNFSNPPHKYKKEGNKK